MKIQEFNSILENVCNATDDELKAAYYFAQRETAKSDGLITDGIVARTCLPRLQNELMRRKVKF